MTSCSRKGIASSGPAIEIVHFPEFDALQPVGKAALDHRAMFRGFDRDNVVGRLEIFKLGRKRQSLASRHGNAQFSKAEKSVQRQRTLIARIEPQTAGSRLPGEAAFRGVPVEINLGEAAAVIVARTKKKHCFHEWVGVMNVWGRPAVR